MTDQLLLDWESSIKSAFLFVNRYTASFFRCNQARLQMIEWGLGLCNLLGYCKLPRTMQPKYDIKKLHHIKAGNCNGLENDPLLNLSKDHPIKTFVLSHPASEPIRDTKARLKATNIHHPLSLIWPSQTTQENISDIRRVKVTGS